VYGPISGSLFVHDRLDDYLSWGIVPEDLSSSE